MIWFIRFWDIIGDSMVRKNILKTDVLYILTLKRLGHFFLNVILFRNVVHHKCDIFIWNCSNTMNV